MFHYDDFYQVFICLGYDSVLFLFELFILNIIARFIFLLIISARIKVIYEGRNTILIYYSFYCRTTANKAGSI